MKLHDRSLTLNHKTRRAPLFLLTAVILASCTGTIQEPGAVDSVDPSATSVPGTESDQDPMPNPTPGPDPTPAPMVTFEPVEDDALLLNPDRGYYVGVDLIAGTGVADVRAKGHTLAIALVRLDAYRDKSLDAAFLASLDQGFARVRAAGIKVVLRFTYNSSETYDASKARILEHVGQLAPILARNADVISVMQAGFIGAWGEWHRSTNGLDNDADRADILKAILAALPKTRTVQVRRPTYKAAIFPGGPLTEEEAFSGTDRARVGHHNDCFLATESDWGTYPEPIETWESFVGQDGRFTPIGGETCALYEPRTNCETALALMQQNHWSYLNLEYHTAVISSWDENGCGDEVRRRLGYRFALTRVAHTEAVPPGGELTVEVDLVNRGFAAPYNNRPVFIVVSDGTTRQVAELEGIDARRWASQESVKLSAKLRIPADATPGTYRVSLWLPDETPGLRADPRYSIRVANQDTWDAATGENVISRTLRIDPAAPGAVDPAATRIAVLSRFASTSQVAE